MLHLLLDSAHYSVYKELTNKVDENFESLLSNGEWINKCYIIYLSDSTAIAVQKPDTLKSVTYNVAEINAEASRVGDFFDWRLPSEDEMQLILANITSLSNNNFWIKAHEASSAVIIKRTDKYGNDKYSRQTETIKTFYVIGHDYKTNEVYSYKKSNIDEKITLEEAGNKHTKANYLIVRSYFRNTPNYEPFNKFKTVISTAAAIKRKRVQ